MHVFNQTIFKLLMGLALTATIAGGGLATASRLGSDAPGPQERAQVAPSEASTHDAGPSVGAARAIGVAEHDPGRSQRRGVPCPTSLSSLALLRLALQRSSHRPSRGPAVSPGRGPRKAPHTLYRCVNVDLHGNRRQQEESNGFTVAGHGRPSPAGGRGPFTSTAGSG